MTGDAAALTAAQCDVPDLDCNDIHGGGRFQEALIANSRLRRVNSKGYRLQNAVFSDAWMHRCCQRGVGASGSTWAGARLSDADSLSGQKQPTDLGRIRLAGASEFGSSGHH
jgi:hypothetical protein